MLRFVANGILLFFCWAACPVGILYCQEQPFTVPTQYYSINEGLSDRLVTDITQTKDGYVWIATSNGLNKFDGYEFVVFNNSPDNPNKLSAFYIDKIQITKQGKLLLTYHNNLTFFDLLDPRTHQLTKVNTGAEKGILGTVRQITVNPDGDILVLTVGNKGTYLHRYLDNGQFKVVFQIEESRDKQTSTTHILQLPDGNYLINDNEKGLRTVSPKGEVLYSYQPSDFVSKSDSSAYPSAAHFLYQDRKGRIWLSLQKGKGIYAWSDSTHQLIQFPGIPALQDYTSVWEDKAGNLLFAQTDGNTPFPNNRQLFCLKADGEVVNFSYLAALGPYIQSVYSDDFFKTIFFGIDTGLKISQNNYSRIKTLLSRHLNADQRGHIMRGITGNSQTVYFTEESGNWYALDLASDQLKKMVLYNAKTGLPLELNCTLDIHLDEKNNLWGISCNNVGEGILLKCNPNTGATETFVYPYKFNAFTLSKDGTFLLLAELSSDEKCKLVRFNPASTIFTEYANQAQQNNPLKEVSPLCIYESRNGLIWVGTGSGLIRIDWQKVNLLTYQMQSENYGKGLKSNTIYAIHEDEAGNLWLGTNNGLSILNPKTNAIKTYDRIDGLASNTVCGIVPNGKGNYWISTYNGLSYYDRKKDEFHSFYQSDGLSHDEFNRFSYFRDVNGRYYFGGVNGLNIFYEKDLLRTEVIPSVVFTKLVRYNSRIDSLITCYNCLAPNKEIVIAPSDTYFQLHFMLPQFANPSRNQFKVKLEGYEKNWTNLGNTPFIRYSKLPPATYTLLVRGADPNGNWSTQTLRLRIRMEPFFYETWEFSILVIIGILALAYVAFRRQLQQKLEVERFRIKLSSDLHDELSGLLSGIAMQTDMLQMNSEDKTINDRLRHIGEVSRKAMSKMSDVIWSIDSRKDKVEDLLKRMREHADDILLPLDIRYSFHANKLDLQHRIPPTTRQELYLIFKESVNNIAKHSDASEVNIQMENADGFFLLAIQDNGRGVPRLQNGHAFSSGQGLSNIKMRAQRINAKVEIIKEAGYTIRLKMRRFA